MSSGNAYGCRGERGGYARLSHGRHHALSGHHSLTGKPVGFAVKVKSMIPLPTPERGLGVSHDESDAAIQMASEDAAVRVRLPVPDALLMLAADGVRVN